MGSEEDDLSVDLEERIPVERGVPASWLIALGAMLVSATVLFGTVFVAFLATGAGDDIERTPTPTWLWVSSALLAASSFTMEIARRAISRFDAGRCRGGLVATAGLGAAFVASQSVVWWQLRDAGYFQPGQVRAYSLGVTTGLHAIHLGVGLLALSILLNSKVGPRSTVEEVEAHSGKVALLSVYWHAMSVLWVGIFSILLWQGI